MKDDIGKIVCYVCDRIVETFKWDKSDYHKGLQRYGFKTVYPHEEKSINFPEGKEYGIHVCQDCLSKPEAMKKLIKRARVSAIEYRINRGNKRDVYDKKAISTIKSRRIANRNKVKILKEYLNSIKNDEDPEHDWDALKIDDQ